MQSITSVKYYDANGTLTTLSGSLYQTDIVSEPARISVSPGGISLWPSTQIDKINAVEIEFVAGYGNAAAVPPGIKHAVKLAVGSLYGYREDEISGTIISKFDRSFERMLYPYRMFQFP